MTEPSSRIEAREVTYDAVIVGGGMGGLTTGALLARAGKKVLVVDDNERPGGHARAFRDDGHVFDSAVHLITRCGRTATFGTGIIDALLRNLGVRELCDLVPVNPFYTVEFPDLRVSVPTGREAFLEAHAQHFPDEAAGLRRLTDLTVQIARELEMLPDKLGIADLLLARWRTPSLFRYRNATLQQVIDRELRDPRCKSLYTTLWSWLGSPPWNASFMVWAYMMAHYIEDGAYYCRGGFQTLADAVATALERAGGELLIGTRVQSIQARDRRVRGVVLDTGQRIEAPLVISNGDPRATFQELLPPGEVPAPFMRRLRRLELAFPCVAAYVATDLDVRALGLGHETLYSTTWSPHDWYKAARAGEVPGLSITIPTLTDPSLAPPGQHIVILMALAPELPGRDSELTQRMLDRAEHLLPGLRDHMTDVVGAPVGELQQLAVRRIESMYGAALTPDQVGGRRLSQRTPVEGLLLVGQWTRPGPGVAGVMESGLDLARRILGRSPAGAALPHRFTPAMTPA